MNEMAEGLGGSYVLDSKTQEPVLSERTKDANEVKEEQAKVVKSTNKEK